MKTTSGGRLDANPLRFSYGDNAILLKRENEEVLMNKLICCEFKGKQASKIESTSLFCTSYTVLHVRDKKNEWSVFVE